MAKMQEFKCPCCGGSIEFDSSVQKMKCPFCDTEFDVGTLSEYAQTVEEEQPEDMSWSDEAGSEWQDGESEGLRTYVCKSCGGEIVGDANTAATACPFCGSPVVMTGQLSGALKPDYVIPFKLDKKAAKERLKKHLTGKRLLPKAFKSENHISEVKGIYVPFWLYDTDADADILANGTLAGMKPHDDITLVDKSMFHKDLVVADCVYNPAETKMVKEAKEAGVKLAVGGKGMLLWQGAASYKLYTGLEMPTDEYQKFQAENEGK